MLFHLLASLAGLGLVAADCNPTNVTCPADPAMPASKTYDLTTSNTADFSYVMASRMAESGSELQFSVVEQGDAPTLVTNDYLLYGNVKATIKTAPGVGMVSAFILMSDVLDEVDWEWLGANDAEAQTNYYYRGETAGYNRGGVSAVSTPAETEHVYEIDWTESTLRWIIDGTTVRTLNEADTTGYGYPSTPCQIKIGVWASGDPTNPAGTIEWGGGLIDYSAGPYTMSLSSLEVTSYTTAGSFVYAAGGETFTISKDSVSNSNGSSTESSSSSSSQASGSQIGGAIKAVSTGLAAASSSSSAATTMSTVTSAPTSASTSTATLAAAAAADAASGGASSRTASVSQHALVTSSGRSGSASTVRAAANPAAATTTRAATTTGTSTSSSSTTGGANVASSGATSTTITSLHSSLCVFASLVSVVGLMLF